MRALTRLTAAGTLVPAPAGAGIGTALAGITAYGFSMITNCGALIVSE